MATAIDSAVTAPNPVQNLVESSVDIQEEFRIISDSVSKIRLRPEHKLNDKGNVKQSLRNTAQILKRCSRYTETILKLLGRVDPAKPDIQSFGDLFVCATAEISYLQDEYANLLAENRYGPDTASVFRDLQSNTSLFNQERVEKLRSAVELQGAYARSQENRSGGNRKSGWQYNSGNQSQFRRYQNRDGRNAFNNPGMRNQDVFNNITQRSVPNVRPAREISRTED
jgi:hypothetical protein